VLIPLWHGRSTASSFIAKCIELGLIRSTDRVLDLCCGSAVDAVFIARRTGASVVGIDCDPDDLARGEERVARHREVRVDLRQGTLPAALHSVSSRSCDVVIDVLGSLNLRRGRSQLAPEMWRILRPGGLWLSQQRHDISPSAFSSDGLPSDLPRNAARYFDFKAVRVTHLSEYANAAHTRRRRFTTVSVVALRRHAPVRDPERRR
jgi:ubiquinone/menaquinone biosynthesis C-methylase UbiE